MTYSNNVCGRMRNSASTCIQYDNAPERALHLTGEEEGCTLNKLEMRFKHTTNTLQYVGIRCHTAKRSQNFVLA